MEFLNIIASIQILFFFFLLFRKENILNKLLAVIILIPGFNFISNTINILGGSGNIPSLYGAIFFFVQGTSLLFAPLVFYYISLMCGKKVKITYFLFWTTAGIILYDIYEAFEFFLLPVDLKKSYLTALKKEDFPIGQLIANLLFIVMQQVYFTIAAIRVYKFKNKIGEVFSTRSTLKVGFIQKFIVLVWVLNIISLVLYATIPMYLVEYIVLPSVIVCINFFIMYYVFEYQMIFNKDTYSIFLKDLKLLDLPLAENNHTLSIQEESNLHSNHILEFLTLNKTYLNKDYTIHQLGADLNESPRTVSKVINSELNKSFIQLINEFRVEESIELLKSEKDKLTIDAIAEKAGFKSRSSFYRVFKNIKGASPTQYIKNI